MRPAARAALAGLIHAAGTTGSVALNAAWSGQAFGPRLTLVLAMFAVAGLVGAALPAVWQDNSSTRSLSARYARTLAGILLITALTGLAIYYGRFLLLYGEFSFEGPRGPILALLSGLAASTYIYWAFGLPLLLPWGLMSAAGVAWLIVRMSPRPAS